MTPLLIELDLESAVALHLALGDQEGKLAVVRRKLLDYLYENLTIEELENVERIKNRLIDGETDLRDGARKGRL
ncbi:MAG: hypothetical protein M0001_12450 [Treponema sp.]|nr:hypothetical protein [Treponema sp.]